MEVAVVDGPHARRRAALQLGPQLGPDLVGDVRWGRGLGEPPLDRRAHVDPGRVLQRRSRALDGALELIGGEGTCVRGVAAALDVVVRARELRVGGDQVDDGHPPARPGDTDHLVELLAWLGEVVHRETAECQVERVIGKGQPGGVGACQRHPVERAVTESAAGDVEHLGREVDAVDRLDAVVAHPGARAPGPAP